MLKVKKGDYGIKVNINHNSSSTVYYSFEGNAEAPLNSNSYFVIDSSMTASSGNKVVKFVTVGNGTRVTSADSYRFQVVD